MTATNDTVRQITDPHLLLDWSMDLAIKAKPQMPMTQAFIDLLKQQAASIHEYGHLPVPKANNKFLAETLFELASPSENVQAGVRLIGLMMNFLHNQIALRKPTEFYLVMIQVAMAANLGKDMQIGIDDHHLVFLSSPKLTRKHGVNVEVIIRHEWKGARIGNPKQAGNDPALFHAVHVDCCPFQEDVGGFGGRDGSRICVFTLTLGG
ncbi:hypothetical protein CN311_16115 [Mesorhizobium sanjuanii]|uniref:Uncharacterized protein n=1 Tax=Mesorhizobium sanjuanii TaxID=2037900 RepID=A0A2A6FDP3_9HYPH|nr:hypothetical protein [Mesorhizobium sanjuanii]PDQ20090.1 hypothetical protein CN311_16115 [Mesorhizobium sanjuanii]